MSTATPCTLFNDVHAKQKEDVLWSDDLLDDDLAYSTKHSCPLIKFARFGDKLTSKDSYRSDDNVIALYGVEADYDEGALPMDAVAAALELAGVTCHLYTSASNTLDKPRWRLLLPFAQEYTGTASEMRAWREVALRKAEYIVGCRFAGESYTLSQAYYIGQVAGSCFDQYHYEGVCIDEMVDITACEVRKVVVPAIHIVKPAPPELKEAKRLLGHIAPDCEYLQWVHVGMALKEKFGPAGFDLWDQWSAGSGNYPGTPDLAFKWDSFSGNGITYATLVHLAREGGSDPGLIIQARLSDPPMVGALMQNPTEDSVALAFAEKYKGEYVYLHGRGVWARWDGTRWQIDKVQRVLEDIRNLARTYNPVGKAQPARSSFVTGVAKYLVADKVFARDLARFDGDNYLLNCPDGTYDLRTMTRREHDPADCITMIARAVPTDTGGRVFRRFLKEITLEDQALEDFLQISLGSCLSGAVEEHWLMFWTGEGRAGKNTLGNAVLYVMGDYARAIPSSTLLSSRSGQHVSNVMTVKGMRLVTSGEVEEGVHWAESTIKELTGDTELTGRYLYKEVVNFTRTHKHLIYGNYRPQLRNADLAIKKRLKIVPFAACFAGREDPNLGYKLEAEADYILYWLMEGHKRWLANDKKVGTCGAVEREADDYYSSQSTIDTWIADCCVVEAVDGQPGKYWVQAKEAYTNYRAWKEERGEGAPSMTRFGEQISKRFEKMKAAGVRYRGLRLRNRADGD